MKRILSICIVAILSAPPLFASSDLPLTPYKENYIQNVTPQEEDQSGYTQAQVSLKYQPLPYDLSPIYIGFTNTFWWKTEEKSSEVSETNYSVELFYRSNTSSPLVNAGGLDLLQFGVDHTSNGKKGDESRSTNAVYGKVGGYTGERFRLGGKITALVYIENSIKNEDIQDYTGNFIYETYLAGYSRAEKEYARLSYRFKLGDNTDLSQGRQEIRLSVTPFPKHLNPSLFVKYETGYGIGGLVDYNQKSDAVMVGLSL